MNAECKRSIDTYLKRDIAAWRGLPDGCNRPELLSSFHFNEGQLSTRLGEQPFEYTSHSLCHPAFAQPIFFAFDRDQLRCISSDFWSLDPELCQITLRTLGQPLHRLDAIFRGTQLPDADWIYPDRGLALCVNPDTHLIARLQGFSPCSLEIYRARFRPMERLREFPLGS
jgi:hypothetical protein